MIDTLSYARRLKGAGFPEAQAEAQAEALAAVLDEDLATKSDLHDLESRLSLRMSELEQRLTLRFGAMLAFGLGAIATLQAIR
jgi:hypothetical protein